MKKFWWVFAGCLLMFLTVPMGALASENGDFMEGCRAQDGVLKVYCADIVPEEENAENCKLTLGGQELQIVSAESDNAQHTPVTYYCLADVSGSMGQEQMTQVREALLAVTAGMQDGDNMVIGTLGNQTQTSGFLTDQEELRRIAEALEAGKEDTNLYAGIVESIRVLQTDTAVNPRKCLIILSDGEDDQKTGITKAEAEAAIEQSSIPVYTVAALKDAGNEAAVSNAKLLGSFARMSTGGAHFAPVLDDITGEQAGQSIVLSVEEGFVVSAKLPEKIPDKDELLLRMVYTSEDNTVYEDTLNVYAEDLTMGIVGESDSDETDEEGQTEPESDPEPILEPDPEPAPEPEQAILPWLIGGAAVFLALIVLIIVPMKKKKKNTEEAEQTGESLADVSYTESAGDSCSQAERENVTAPLREKKSVSVPSYELRLYAIGYTEIVHTLRLEQGRKVTIGRNGKADIILDSNDKKLSGIQCRMQWEDGKLYVWDMDSTNGTFVNGVSIKAMGRVVVHEGDTIRMGSYEYRVGRP